MRIDKYLTSTPPPRGLFARPSLALAFRPFFLVAGLMAALWLPLWLVIHLAGLRLPLAVEPTLWHAHELVFGFASAVLAGFLLTAARNWTKRPTPSGGPLAALVAVWLAGRVVMLVGAELPPLVVALVDLAFLPLVALALARPLLAARDRRNYAFAALLLVLAGIGALFHAGDAMTARLTMTASVSLVVVFLVVMGGRVIPFFTRNACPDARVRTPAWLAWTAAITTGALVPGQLWLHGPVVDVVAIVAGLANLARLALWDTRKTLGNPLLWVLHAGYAFIGVGLVMQGLAPLAPDVFGTAPTHALTVGALGTLVLGMMARVSLGHTGRPLAAPRPVALAFGLVLLAALLRVVPPLISPDLYVPALVASGSVFALAFGIFVAVYAPILTRPRVDGAPG
ncbi:MAG: NnrS family protein [Deltaproteobacteria bacterium]|nr:NnrS family protein [Deltaproteobacteria bacterium]